MNEIINWVAINNTLMIRLGFSAILILVVVYIFRFIFIPQIKVVNQAEETSSTYDTADDLLKAAVAEGLAMEADTAPANEAVEKLQLEINVLKNKLKEREAKGPSAEAQAGAGGAGVVSTSDSSGGLGSNDELNTKIKALEARLSEYEIIAEDISEISKLRQENEQLKSEVENFNSGKGSVKELTEDEVKAQEQSSSQEADLEAFDAADESAAAEPQQSSVAEIEPEVAAAEQADALLEEAAQEAEGGEAAEKMQARSNEVTNPRPPMGQVVIQSEVEVTEDEKLMIDDFEKDMNSKKGQV